MLVVAASLAAASMTFTASAATAQITPIPPPSQTGMSGQNERDRQQLRETRRTQDRIDEAQNSRRGRMPSPEQVKANAQGVATSAGLSCRVTEATLLGRTDDDNDLYEVACDGGVGYLLQSSTPPQTFDCLILANQAERLRAQGGEVPAGSTCALPGNQNTMAVFAGYARAAGVPCEIDAAQVVGKTPAGNTVYEVGCPGADGWHIEQAAQGWTKTDCLEVMSTNLTCQFTTAEEQAAGFKPKLVGTDIDDCDAQRIQLLGQNDNGRFIEVKCASGEGYVTRMKDEAVAQVYPCALAIRIGGGCTMTPVAASSEQQ
ncbi:MAG: hypothetical protein EON91_11840 [Brevundimonas sp.]|uniref:hypothetical protein n=1 Tax=Brevundimonas sp. TaxID=1871086 RepID=UPI0011F7A66D|nr:hypothetical protein [Brevundimonas sp.]RZJ16767.1 MAG: hypothetical protein EON91_11840 [Brevundimonas sp.]